MVASTLGCANNDLTLSILQMEAVLLPACMATSSSGTTGTAGRDRGLLDVTLVTSSGYIGTPVVRNNLQPRNSGAGSVEFNSIQLTGADVYLTLPPAAAGKVPASELSFFFASAAGRLDPGGTAPMFVEVIPAAVAKQLASSVPRGMFLTVMAEIKPVGLHNSDQVVGGPIQFPIDLCSNCLISVAAAACPFPKGTTVQPGGCFPQQDDPLMCCVNSAGTTLCGASAPVATM